LKKYNKDYFLTKKSSRIIVGYFCTAVGYVSRYYLSALEKENEETKKNITMGLAPKPKTGEPIHILLILYEATGRRIFGVFESFCKRPVSAARCDTRSLPESTGVSIPFTPLPDLTLVAADGSVSERFTSKKKKTLG